MIEEWNVLLLVIFARRKPIALRGKSWNFLHTVNASFIQGAKQLFNGVNCEYGDYNGAFSDEE